MPKDDTFYDRTFSPLLEQLIGEKDAKFRARFPREELPYHLAVRNVRRIEQALEANDQFMAKLLQNELDRLNGEDLQTLERKKEVASKIQDITTRIRHRILCPREGCGVPSLIRAVESPKHPEGVFQFDHELNGRRSSHREGRLVPKLVLQPMVAKKKRGPKKKD